MKIWLPGDSKWPFDSLVGGHLTPEKDHLTIPKRSQRITRSLNLLWKPFTQTLGSCCLGLECCWSPRLSRYFSTGLPPGAGWQNEKNEQLVVAVFSGVTALVPVYMKFKGCWYYHLMLLMEEILHQLRLVVYLIIYEDLYIQTVVVWDFFHQQSVQKNTLQENMTAGFLNIAQPWNAFFFVTNQSTHDFMLELSRVFAGRVGSANG